MIDTAKLKILFIPLDNRPVSYLLPKQIADINNSLDLILPPRELLGGLNTNSNIDGILKWLNDALNNDIDFVICCLDTIAYGGLIPSRRDEVALETIKDRICKLQSILNKNQSAKVFAFSSVMRLSNNNINEEEKEYWNQYGELIFQHSYLSHKCELNDCSTLASQLVDFTKRIPQDVLNDYVSTRHRNFAINKHYVELLKDGFFQYLVFSQDDTAEFGFNVKEANELKQLIIKSDLSDCACVKTGADEIPSSLLARSIIKSNSEKINIFPVYSTDNGKNIISRYEDITIEDSVKGQITLCGANVSTSLNDADLVLLVHTPQSAQNDHCLNIHKDAESFDAINKCFSILNTCNKPVAIADIANANGSDNIFVQKLIAQNIDISKLYGYAGWNTTGNTLGSVIAMAVARFIAEKSNSFDAENFKKTLFVRFVDDWAYQTIARQKIRAISDKPDKILLKEEISPYIEKLSFELGVNIEDVKLSFPWNRTFEIEVSF